MTYVYDNLASKIKRNPTIKEAEKVKKQKSVVDALYREYYIKLRLMRQNGILERETLQNLWYRYLTELHKYNDLFNYYMGYCY